MFSLCTTDFDSFVLVNFHHPTSPDFDGNVKIKNGRGIILTDSIRFIPSPSDMALREHLNLAMTPSNMTHSMICILLLLSP